MAETVRSLTRVSAEMFHVSARRWELTFESEAVEGQAPAKASLTLVVLENQYGNVEEITISAISERSRPHPSPEIRSNPNAFMNYLRSIDLTPIDGMAEGEWRTDDVLVLAETGQFTDDSIPRWVWQAFMDEPAIRDVMLEVVTNVSGGVTHPEIFEHTLPARGHLRAV